MKSFIKVFTFFMVVFACTTAYSQEYNSAVGLRFGSPWSVSYKKFLNESNAVEIYGGVRNYGSFVSAIHVAAAYQIHKPIASVSGLQWYYGFGAGLALYSFDTGYTGSESKTSLGLSGYLGLDYKFDGTPINVSVDWVPTFYLGGYGSGFGADYGALAVRYTLN